MKRWIWKRWAWTGVFGITAAVGLALGAGKDASPTPAAPPKIGDVITLRFEKGPEKKVKIVKTERQEDGSYQSEVKDMKTGEVFTLRDESHMPPKPLKGAAKTGVKAPMASPAPQSSSPAAMTAAPTTSTPSKLPVTPKGIKTADVSAPARMSPPAASPKMTPPAARPSIVAAPTPMPEPMAEPQKKPGLLKRLFGKDSPPAAMPTPNSPAMPITTTKPATPPDMPVTSARPLTPAKNSAPMVNAPTSVFESGPAPGAKAASRPRIFSPSSSVFEGAAPRSDAAAGKATVGGPKFVPDRSSGEPPRGRTIEPNLGSAFLPPMDRTAEPPRTLPMNSVTPPKPVIPVPVTPPSAPPTAAPSPLPIPSAPARIPAPAVETPSTTIPSAPVTPMTPPPVATPAIPVPSTPTPVIPAIPTTPALPTIPTVPGGTSMNRSAVMQAGMKSPVAAMAADIQPHVTSLRTAAAPSVRAMAARALSGGRHASSETVKEVLFIACTSDPSSFVRACCIEELCKLGYFDPEFMAHLHKACADQSEEVRIAAREALKKMTPGSK